MRNLFLTTLFAFIFFSCTTSQPTVAPTVTQTQTQPQPQTQAQAPITPPPPPVKPIKVMQEFRAAWIATVANINWPSKPGLSTEEQKKEAIDLLNYLYKHNFNAAILQVRPQTDALYESSLEPWSYYLTGKQGKAPEPYYDPLQFWIEEAHDRGIELHVWLNPYRAHHTSGKEVTEHSIVKKRPELVQYLKEGYWWMDPSLKGTQDHSTAVVMDIVKRYDIDGVHFDDYFYPYPSYNKGDDFPDDKSWAAYQKSGGKLSRGDWRRESVNVFIERVYKSIKAEKQHVKFGLSPFGLYRPGYPESIEGFDQYEQLYADAKLWLNEGWIDYFTPQLYWTVRGVPQSFPVLLGWWQEENKMNRHLWPGMNVGRDTALRSVHETLNQIMITRGMVPQSKGAVHWSISPVKQNVVLSKMLLDGPYKKPALVPASPWLDEKAPLPPTVTTAGQGDSLYIEWTHENPNDVFRWVIYYQHGNVWDYTILNRGARSVSIPGTNAQKKKLERIAITAVDRVGNESSRKEIILTK